MAAARGGGKLIPVEARVEVPFPLASVWPLLADPMTVASCIPGARLQASTGQNSYSGAFEFRFGPTVATFLGEVELIYDAAAHRCAIDGRGADKKGASRAVAKFDLTASGSETTRLDLDGGFNVVGPLGMFASAGGVHLARALVIEFGDNLQKVLQARHLASQPDAPEAASVQPEAPRAARLSDLLRLLWRAFTERFRKRAR